MKKVLLKTFNIRGVSPQNYFFGASAVLGLLFAVITEPQNPVFWGSHYVMWQLQTLLPVSILVLVHIGLHANSTFDAFNPWLKLFISGVFGAVLFVPVALGIDIVWGNNQPPTSTTAFMSLLIDEAIAVIPPVSISWVAINAPWLLFFTEQSSASDSFTPIESHSSTDDQTTKSADEQKAHSGFQALLCADIQGTLLYIKSELHYLLVVTERGKELVLYNLSDAINELSQHQGIQTHRSFWVAKKAVASLALDGRQGLLKLVNGDEIPVSRTKLQQVKNFLAPEIGLQ